MEAKKVNQHLIGKTYHEIVDHLQFDEDEGDCCGYASYDVVASLPDGTDLNKLVLYDCVRLDYDEEYESRAVLNFLFFTEYNDTLILGYELRAGSGSGWQYGAYVTMKHGDTELATASW